MNNLNYLNYFKNFPNVNNEIIKKINELHNFNNNYHKITKYNIQELSNSNKKFENLIKYYKPNIANLFIKSSNNTDIFINMPNIFNIISLNLIIPYIYKYTNELHIHTFSPNINIDNLKYLKKIFYKIEKIKIFAPNIDEESINNLNILFIKSDITKDYIIPEIDITFTHIKNIYGLYKVDYIKRCRFLSKISMVKNTNVDDFWEINDSWELNNNIYSNLENISNIEKIWIKLMIN